MMVGSIRFVNLMAFCVLLKNLASDANAVLYTEIALECRQSAANMKLTGAS